MPAPEMCTYCGENPAVIFLSPHLAARRAGKPEGRAYCTKDCMYDDYAAERRRYLKRRTYNALGGAS